MYFFWLMSETFWIIVTWRVPKYFGADFDTRDSTDGNQLRGTIPPCLLVWLCLVLAAAATKAVATRRKAAAKEAL